MNILIDMDNTLAEFDAGLLRIWQKLYPNEVFVPLESRKAFHPHKDYPFRLQDRVQEICHSEGFIFGLDPVPGGIQAVNDMLNMGHDVRFCTSYLFDYKYCVFEKYHWVEKHFGKDYIEKIVVTRDKTLITGDLLIDDKPEILGINTPTWEHVLYDRPYNRQVQNHKRLTWDNWREVIADIIQ